MSYPPVVAWRLLINRILPIILLASAAVPQAEAGTLVDLNAEWRYLKGLGEASVPDFTAWRQRSFNDSTFTAAPAPFWYGDAQPSPGTQLNDMQNNYSSIFLRKSFLVSSPADIAELQLVFVSDDGMIAWINGVEVARFNMPSGAVPYNGLASAALPEPIPLTTNVIPNTASLLVAGTNVLAIHAFNTSLSGSSDFVLNAALYSIQDELAPVVAQVIPVANAVVPELHEIEVVFSEPVDGVEAADLLINAVPATNVEELAPGQFLFSFETPATGRVEVAWSSTHGIRDRASTPNPFGGGNWVYELDPNATVPDVVINEFMADNEDTLHDEDGDDSDWIELWNPGAQSLDLTGWYLTDDAANLRKWQFPALTLQPNAYLVVFASEKNRTNSAGQLHTNFRLSTDGEYLALVRPDGSNVVSEFAPGYPRQFADVSYGRDRGNLSILAYFPTPTPRAPNAAGGAGFAEPVEFSRLGGTFTAPFQLSLSTLETNAVIRYTLNGALPGTNSPIYTSPITVSNTVQVRAQAFVPGLFPSPVRSEGYIALNPNVVGFSSDLPIVVIHNFGAGTIPGSGDQLAYLTLHEPKNGRSLLTNSADLRSRAGINIRGSSTQGYAKSSWAVEWWDEFNDDKDLEVLGMPAESDWVLYAPNNFEPVLIHNPLAFELSNDIGRYAPRTRFVEVYVNTGGGPVTAANYNGVYVLMEKIKRSPGRVDVARLEAEQTTLPDITGGYMFKTDRQDSNERSFTAAGQRLIYVYPDGIEMETPQRDVQEQWIQNYFTQFGAALNGPNWTNAVTGYPAFVDIGSWIDHHIINVLTFNVDAIRLSGYYFKDRGQKIEMGPIWDFDRSLNSTDGRDANPRVWRSQTGDLGTDFFNSQPGHSPPYVWYGRVFQDPNFWQAWIDRWADLRETYLSTNHLFGLIDDLTAQVREAQPREVQRWPGHTPRGGSYTGEINLLKNWLVNRIHFIDTNFLARPQFSAEGGPIDPGFVLFITAPAGSTIYYTLDGTDPRAPGGAIASNAIAYMGPITLNSNARVFARARNPSHRNLTGPNNPPVSSPWSAPQVETFVTALPTLVITEIMYHPQDAPPGSTNADEDFEYIELMNVGSAPVNLAGFAFTNGITFNFTGSSVTNLAPGERVLVLGNRAAFVSRYGDLPNIAGEYSGRLSNGGERLYLEGPLKETLHDFSYESSWYPIVTDGIGFSLVVRDPMAPREQWGNRTNWRASTYVKGSPGQADPEPIDFAPVLVNEVLTHSGLTGMDVIELYNPGTNVARIGGWFLTDDIDNPVKYRIPDGRTIEPGGFAVFTETDFNAQPQATNSFALSALGDEVYLFSADTNGLLTGYLHGFDFGPAALGVSFGRHVTSLGDEHFPAQRTNTFGELNAGPRVGPIVISEIMYRPPDLGAVSNLLDNVRDEFIELRNLSDEPIPLFDPDYPTNTWFLEKAVDFVFPTNVVVPPQGSVLVVSFDPARNSNALAGFLANYPLTNALVLFGPYTGKLDNSDERVELRRPGTPVVGSGQQVTIPGILVERVDYADVAPWPVNVDGSGGSLQRIEESAYANDPANWTGAGPTLGERFRGGVAPTITLQPQSQTVVAYTDPVLTVGVVGDEPFTYQWRFNGMNLVGARGPTLTLTNIQAEQAGTYSVIVFNAGGGEVSSNANVTVLIPPTIVGAPQPRSVAPGATTNFVVNAFSSLPLSYQWFFNGVPIPGATQPMLEFNNVQLFTHAGDYHVVVSNEIGVATSDPVGLLVRVRPTIIVQPQSQSAPPGGQALFYVVAEPVHPTLPLAYSWRRNGAILPNETNSFLVVRNVSSNATYTVRVLNPVSSVFSTGAALTVASDRDGDGLPDSYEEALGYNPDGPGDAALDEDQDGMSTRDEFIAGTNPKDAASYLRVELPAGFGSAPAVLFPAVSNRSYSIEFAEELGSGWLKLLDIEPRASNRIETVTDAHPGTNRFYRVVTPAQP